MYREQGNSCLDGLAIQAVSDLTMNSINSQSWNIHVRYIHETNTTEKRNCKFGLLHCLKEKTIKLELLLHYLINSVVNRRVQFHLWNILIVKKILINEHKCKNTNTLFGQELFKYGNPEACSPFWKCIISRSFLK